MKQRIICGRYDCCYYSSGACRLSNIGIGKDLTCQSYRSIRDDELHKQMNQDRSQNGYNNFQYEHIQF